MTIMDKEDELLVSTNAKKRHKKTKKTSTPKKQKDNERRKTLDNNEKKSNKQTKKKQNVLMFKIISFLLIVLTVITISHILIEEIFSLFYMVPIAIVSLAIVLIISFVLNKKNLRRWIKRVFSLFAILIMIFEILMLLFGTKTLKFLSSITDTGYRVESFGVYVLDSSSIKDIKELDNKSIYYLNHDDNKNIKEALKKLDKEIDFKENSKDNASSLVDELINKSADAILMDTSYEVLLEEEYGEKYKQIRLIETIDIVDVVDTIKSDVDITKEPFVVYISGIDTSGNVASKARSDVNMLVAVNPTTKNILMVNTPRDYYVTLNGKNKKDKLTHAGLYGVEESVGTLSKLYDTDIDYYVRINFTSFVRIVDELGGIKVNVPLHFCEQNSKRSKAPNDLICLNKGVQNLNGEQALALARHRKTLPTGDRGRGENQMLVLEAIINKAMSPKIISKYSSLIDALKGRISTNMTSNEIIKFAKKQVNNLDAWEYTTLSAKGNDSSGICYATGAGRAYVMEQDETSVNEIKTALDRLFAGEKDIVIN